MKATLEIVSEVQQGEKFTLEESSYVIGRHATCNIPLREINVSRDHARVVKRDERYFIEDLDSLNGTYLNGEQVAGCQELVHGDHIYIGDFDLVYHDGSGAVKERAGPYVAEVNKVVQRDTRQTKVMTMIDVAAASDERVGLNAKTKLRAILEMVHSLAEPATFGGLLDRILESTMKIFPNADQGCILLADDPKEQLRLHAIRHRTENRDNPLTLGHLGRDMAKRVMQDGHAMLGTNAFDLAGDGQATMAICDEYRFTMCAPLLGLGHRAVGVIQLDSEASRPIFDAEDLDVLVNATALAGQAIERKRAEERFRGLLESAPDAIVIADNQGHIVLINKQTEVFFGWDREQIVGRHVEMLFAERNREKYVEFRDQYFQYRTARPMGANLELFGLRQDGSEFPVEISLSPLTTETGIFVSAAIRDVSERKRMEAELARQNEQLVQVERLAAVGEMVAGLSHESRNALQRIQACVSLLDRRVDDQETRELVTQIQAAQDDLQRLFEQVRQFSAPTRLDKRRHRLVEIFNSVWKDLAIVREGRKIQLRHRGQIEDVTCLVDRFAVGQVFRNVLENSLQACQDPVQLDISWSLGTSHGQSACRVAIRDNGPGLSDEQLANIFEPFFTTKTKGTGLGMSISRRLVEAHGGVIRARAGEGPGTEVSIILPRGDRT